MERPKRGSDKAAWVEWRQWIKACPWQECIACGGKFKPSASDDQEICHVCLRTWVRLDEIKQEWKDPKKVAYWLKTYNLSNFEYAAIQKRQRGVCGICEREVDLLVDHDHDSGEVRGLLCHHCNVGLGFFQDNPKLLHKAAEYLGIHKKRLEARRPLTRAPELAIIEVVQSETA